MKCKIFVGRWYDTQDAFNKWAKGKALTREVIIHEVIAGVSDSVMEQFLMIIVYHPEGEHWDRTETK